MDQKACIYCGRTDNLSASDIIPDALTNAKIINHNVCQDEHNSKFSNMFESDVIERMAFVTNKLGVKSSKSDSFPKYDTTYIIDGKEYNKKVSSDASLFWDGKIISSIDGKTKIGPLDQLKKIKSAKPESISLLNINNLTYDNKTHVDLEVFVSESMCRMITKIAYEWYCLCNDVSGKIGAFADTIDYICTGKGNNPVSIVSNSELYKGLDNIADFGSHILISYIGADGSVNIIVSLFGIAIYNVRLLDYTIQSCKNNAIFLKLSLDSKRVSFKFKDANELNLNFWTSFESHNNKAFTIMIPKKISDSSLLYQMFYLMSYEQFQHNLKCTKTYGRELISMFNNNLHRVVDTSVLTLKAIKKFVKDNEKAIRNSNELNFRTINSKDICSFYYLFIIGDPHNEIKIFDDFTNYIISKENTEKVIVNSEKIDKIKEEMKSNEKYYDYIKNGINIVNQW